MILELSIVSLLVVISVLNIVINKKMPNIIRSSVGILASLSYLLFKFIPALNNYMVYYLLVDILIIIFEALFLFPKKVTKNITEYDYFDLEKSYYSLKDDKEKLRQRFLSTISLIDEGMIFYENGNKDVILSDFAYEIFGGKQSLTLEEHALRINQIDRGEYLNTIRNISKKNLSYEIKYRITKNDEIFWVLERGHYIGVDNKKSIIATIKPLDVKLYKSTSYFDIDSLYGEDKMYPILKELRDTKKPYSFIYFELTNIPTINAKYSREVGSLMMNDYLKLIKNRYQRDINKFYRISGIRFIFLIDNQRDYEEFHRDLINNQSELYNTRIQISGIKDVIVPNFGVVNIQGNKPVDSLDLYKLATRLLDEAVESNRRSYSIFGE